MLEVRVPEASSARGKSTKDAPECVNIVGNEPKQSSFLSMLELYPLPLSIVHLYSTIKKYYYACLLTHHQHEGLDQSHPFE